MSVVICAYTVDRWADLQRAVASAVAQEVRPTEVVVVIDHNGELFVRASGQWPGGASTPAEPSDPVVRVIASAGAPGLSGARNTGVSACSSDIVAFMDDDAVADTGWLQALVEHFSEADVVACGGLVDAAPVGPRPAWWPLEFDWVVGCSYRGLPTSTATVRNPIGASMAMRRSPVLDVGGFAEGIGRVGSRPVGCEETDLFIRLHQRWPEARVVYEPASRVRHTVPPARFSWRYFRSRCFAEGLSKADVATRVGQNDALASERAYLSNVLPSAVGRALLATCRREEGAALRAFAIGAGLALTTAGYVWGRLMASSSGVSIAVPVHPGFSERRGGRTSGSPETGPRPLPLGTYGSTE